MENIKMETEARELELFIENDQSAYNDLIYTLKNLRKHFKRGNFDQVKALKGLSHPIDRSAKAYNKQHSSGSDWYNIFPVEARKITAVSLLETYIDDICCDDDKDYMDLDA